MTVYELNKDLYDNNMQVLPTRHIGAYHAHIGAYHAHIGTYHAHIGAYHAHIGAIFEN